MDPESDFCWLYRFLIQFYRLTPELSARQLEAILMLHDAAKGSGTRSAGGSPDSKGELKT